MNMEGFRQIRLLEKLGEGGRFFFLILRIGRANQQNQSNLAQINTDNSIEGQG